MSKKYFLNEKKKEDDEDSYSFGDKSLMSFGLLLIVILIFGGTILLTNVFTKRNIVEKKKFTVDNYEYHISINKKIERIK